LASLPTPTRTGYRFDGWYNFSTPKIETSKVYTANTTIFAKWTKIGIVITFNANGGAVSPDAAVADANGKLASLPTPTRTGYRFDGWYTAYSGGTKVTIDDAYITDKTIYAQWTRSYTITFNPNGGTCSVASAQVDRTNGKLASLPTPTRAGTRFEGWHPSLFDGSGTLVTVDTVYTYDTTLYAHWSQIITITFNSNGGTCSVASAQADKTSGKLTSLPSPGREGYQFDGWFTSLSDGAGTRVTIDKVYTYNTTIYARWSKIITITFDWNDGTGSTYSYTNVGAETFKLTSFPTYHTREGYSFDGWYTLSDRGTKVTLDRVYTANTTLYAHWAQAQTTAAGD
jgi:uncharacterized repeat protein (TIGR02543 family)